MVRGNCYSSWSASCTTPSPSPTFQGSLKHFDGIAKELNVNISQRYDDTSIGHACIAGMIIFLTQRPSRRHWGSVIHPTGSRTANTYTESLHLRLTDWGPRHHPEPIRTC